MEKAPAFFDERSVRDGLLGGENRPISFDVSVACLAFYIEEVWTICSGESSKELLSISEKSPIGTGLLSWCYCGMYLMGEVLSCFVAKRALYCFGC